MGTTNLPQTRADDLRWTIDPIPRLETLPTDATDLVNLSPVELIDYVLDLREDAAALRATLHAALHAVADLTSQVRRSTATVARLRDELREYRRAA